MINFEKAEETVGVNSNAIFKCLSKKKVKAERKPLTSITSLISVFQNNPPPLTQTHNIIVETNTN